MTMECPECGKIEESRKWISCGTKHRTVPMYQVLSFDRTTRLAMSQARKNGIENKGE